MTTKNENAFTKENEFVYCILLANSSHTPKTHTLRTFAICNLYENVVVIHYEPRYGDTGNRVINNKCVWQNV